MPTPPPHTHTHTLAAPPHGAQVRKLGDRAAAWAFFASELGEWVSSWEGRKSAKKYHKIKVLRMSLPISRNVHSHANGSYIWAWEATLGLASYSEPAFLEMGAISELGKEFLEMGAISGLGKLLWAWEATLGSYSEPALALSLYIVSDTST